MINILQPGFVLQNRYQVICLLGQGGFGAVYLAQDMRLSNRSVAVKENFDASAQAQTQFRIEANVLANLNHPNLPRVTDYLIESSGRQYLVMDYIEGDDLETIVTRSGRLSEAQALPWIEQVCDALTYLHTQLRPIIHRDIKPTNIRVRVADGRAMLVDFGIAKVYDPTQKTLLGARAVSPGYSPLEQYGKGITDARSDVYALGATMYFVFTGVQPPEATDLASRVEQLRPLRLLNPYLSQQIEQVVLKAMEVFADARYPSADGLRQALRTSIGASLPSAPSLSQILCPICGARNRAAAGFCQKCGYALGAHAPSSPLASPGGRAFVPLTPSVAPVISAPPALVPVPVPTSQPRPMFVPRGTQTISFRRYIATVVLVGVLFGAITSWLLRSAGSYNVLVFGGAYSIAAPLGYLLLKRPGAAFFSGLVQSITLAFLLGGFSVLNIFTLLIAMEIVFALGRYKSDGARISMVAPAVSWGAQVFFGYFDWLLVIGGALGGLVAFLIAKTIKR